MTEPSNSRAGPNSLNGLSTAPNSKTGSRILIFLFGVSAVVSEDRFSVNSSSSSTSKDAWFRLRRKWPSSGIYAPDPVGPGDPFSDQAVRGSLTFAISYIANRFCFLKFSIIREDHIRVIIHIVLILNFKKVLSSNQMTAEWSNSELGAHFGIEPSRRESQLFPTLLLVADIEIFQHVLFPLPFVFFQFSSSNLWLIVYES